MKAKYLICLLIIASLATAGIYWKNQSDKNPASKIEYGVIKTPGTAATVGFSEKETKLIAAIEQGTGKFDYRHWFDLTKEKFWQTHINCTDTDNSFRVLWFPEIKLLKIEFQHGRFDATKPINGFSTAFEMRDKDGNGTIDSYVSSTTQQGHYTFPCPINDAVCWQAQYEMSLKEILRLTGNQ